jgi:hypothetical protein
MNAKTLKVSAVAAVMVGTLLLIGFILEIITAEALRDTLTKALLTIGAIALATLVISTITRSN